MTLARAPDDGPGDCPGTDGVVQAQLHRSIVRAHGKAGSLPGGEILLTELLERLRDAQNNHDLDAFIARFHPDYRSEPRPSDRAFVGSEQARSNWAEVFAGVPDFQAELVRSAQAADTGWAEWHWHGTRTDKTLLDKRGVTHADQSTRQPVRTALAFTCQAD